MNFHKNWIMMTGNMLENYFLEMHSLLAVHATVGNVTPEEIGDICVVTFD